MKYFKFILPLLFLSIGWTSSSAFEEDATYVIQHVATGKYLLLDSEYNDGSYTTAATLSETQKTVFTITEGASSSCYYMMDANSGLYMSSWYNSANYNALVAIDEAREVKIDATGVDDIYYMRRSSTSGKYFGADNYGDIYSNYTSPVEWRFEKVENGGGGGEEDPNATLIINEIMTANLGEAIDPSYNFGAWVELYNPGESSVKLTGMTVSDGKGNSFKLTSYHGNVPAKGFKNLWFEHYSNDNTHYSSSYKTYKAQVDLELDTDGGIIRIEKNGVTLDEVTYPEAISRCSWARTTNGGEAWSYCAWPTAEKTNEGAQFSDEQCEAPTTNRLGGNFSGSTSVTVTVPEGATLVYTTDGTAPTKTNGIKPSLNNGQTTLNVNNTTCYRFRTIADDKLPSKVITRSFIKSTSGFNIISVVTDEDYLYDNKIGIYVKGTNNGSSLGGWSYWQYANFYQDWDRPVNVEIFDSEDIQLVNQEANMTMSGGKSRENSYKSFKLKTKKIFDGLNFFQTQGIYPQKPYNRYKDILVRAGGDDDEHRHLDNVLQQIMINSGLYLDAQAYRPVEVYFNGEDIGLFMIREVTNKQYGASNYGMNTDEMDTFEENDILGMTISAGTWDAFDELYTASKTASSSEASWEKVKSLLDIDEFINYFAADCYVCNEDWPQNNFKMFRDKEDGRFHCVLQDTDWAFGNNDPFGHMEDQNPDFGYAEIGYAENRQNVLFLNLMNREDFRRKFVDAFCLMTGSVFDPTYVKEQIAAMTSECTRYYGNYSYYFNNTMSTIQSELSSSYQSARIKNLKNWSRAKLSNSTSIAANISANITDAKILLNSIEIPRTFFNGTLFLPITLEAQVPNGYIFEGWSLNGSIVSSEKSYTLTKSGTYIAKYAKKNDDSLPPVVVNEVGANNGVYINDNLKRRDWIELFNTTDTDINVDGLYLSNDITNPQKYQITTDAVSEASTIIPAHGFLIVWADKETGNKNLHAPFKLANDSSQIVILSAPDGTWTDTLRYHRHNERQSVGRYPDGGKDIYLFDVPTIAKDNLFTSCSRLLTFPDPILDAIATIKEEDDDVVYDLQGRRINTTSSGVFIKNHKKIIK